MTPIGLLQKDARLPRHVDRDDAGGALVRAPEFVAPRRAPRKAGVVDADLDVLFDQPVRDIDNL